MIKTIRVMLEYGTYPIWLYDEYNEILDNDNPPEWNNDKELTDAFMAVSDLYDTFFIDTPKVFEYIGCPDDATKQKLSKLFDKAMKILIKKNNGKYKIWNSVDIDKDVDLSKDVHDQPKLKEQDPNLAMSLS